MNLVIDLKKRKKRTMFDVAVITHVLVFFLKKTKTKNMLSLYFSFFTIIINYCHIDNSLIEFKIIFKVGPSSKGIIIE